jgi:hypothetical protein
VWTLRVLHTNILQLDKDIVPTMCAMLLQNFLYLYIKLIPIVVYRLWLHSLSCHLLSGLDTTTYCFLLSQILTVYILWFLTQILLFLIEFHVYELLGQLHRILICILIQTIHLTSVLSKYNELLIVLPLKQRRLTSTHNYYLHSTLFRNEMYTP